MKRNRDTSILFLNHTFVQAGEEAVVGADVANGAFDPGSWGQYLGGTYSLHRAPGFIDMSHIIGKAMVKSACQVRINCVCMKRVKGTMGEGDRGSVVPSEDSHGRHNDRRSGVYIGVGIHTDTFTGAKPSSQDLHMHAITRRPHPYKGWVPDLQPSSPELSISPLLPSSEVLQRENISYSSHGNGFTSPFIRCCAGNASQYGEEASCGQWGRLWNLHVHSKNTLPFLSKKCNC